MTETEKTEFLETMRKRREVGEQAEQHNRAAAIAMLNFIFPTEEHGQWPESLYNERIRRGMVSLTLNRLPSFLNQVTGDQLINRPQIKVRPASLDSDQKGATNREGIIRQSEQVSRAKFIVDQSYKTMCASGYPTHWQINTRHISDDAIEKEIVWEPIEDQFSVIRDPYAIENDRRDANWLMVLETISEDEYKRRYPDKEIPTDSGASGIASQYSSWFESGKTVTLAIYWQRKSKKRTLCVLPDGRKAWKDALDKVDGFKEAYETLSKTAGVVREFERDDWSTSVSVCTGTEVIEEPKDMPWKWIPVVSLFPPYVIKEGKRWYRGLCTDAMDPQRFYNYWKSMNAQQVKPKPTYVTMAMIKNYLKFWDHKDKSNLEYLPVDAPDGQWPKDNPPPQLSTAIVHEEQGAIDDIKATVGMWNQSLGASEQSLSGKAIGKLQMAGDKGNMEFTNSLTQALTFTGDIILDMNPHVNDTEMEIPIITFDNTPSKIRINRRVEGGTIENDMTSGKYRAVVDVGPNFTTQRQEALDSMIALATGNPQIAGVLAPFMAKYGDWPDSEKIFAILKAVLPPNIQALYDEQEEGSEDPKIVQIRMAFETQIKAVAAQLEQAGVTVQQQAAMIEEMKAVLAAKEEDARRMQADFEIAKREAKVKADEDALFGKGAKLQSLMQEIDGVKQVIQSMDKALSMHIDNRPPSGGPMPMKGEMMEGGQ